MFLFDEQNFNGQTGRAFLFDAVVNISLGDAEDRHMTTGLHTVRDIRCAKCKGTLGWKYVRAKKGGDGADGCVASAVRRCIQLGAY